MSTWNNLNNAVLCRNSVFLIRRINIPIKDVLRNDAFINIPFYVSPMSPSEASLDYPRTTHLFYCSSMITNDMLLTERKWVSLLTGTTFDNTMIDRIARVEIKQMRGLDDNANEYSVLICKCLNDISKGGFLSHTDISKGGSPMISPCLL